MTTTYCCIYPRCDKQGKKPQTCQNAAPAAATANRVTQTLCVKWAQMSREHVSKGKIRYPCSFQALSLPWRPFQMINRESYNPQLVSVQCFDSENGETGPSGSLMFSFLIGHMTRSHDTVMWLNRARHETLFFHCCQLMFGNRKSIYLSWIGPLNIHVYWETVLRSKWLQLYSTIVP